MELRPNCAQEHKVFVYDRGGQRRLFQLVNLSQVRWGRVRDDVSQADIRLDGDACIDNAGWLASLEPKRHELVIFRGTTRVWEGPVWRVAWHEDYVEINAHDVFEYLNARPLSRDWDNAYRGNQDNTTTVTQRSQDIITYELTNPFSWVGTDGNTVTVPAWESIDPPINVLPHLRVYKYVDDARTSTHTTPFQMTVGEHIDNMARSSGLDYTVVGRAIHLWDVHRSIGRGRQLTSADFDAEAVVTAYGADHAEIAFVVAEDGRYGGAGDNSSYYGPWTKMFTVYDEDESKPPTQADLNSQAQRNLSGRTPVPVEIRVPENSTIRLSDSLTINHLVPGVRFPLAATLNARKVTQMMRLNTMQVTETGAGETITVSFVPANNDDND